MSYKITTLEDLPNEVWVDVFGFDGLYEVSNLGRYKSLGRYVNIRNGQRWAKERVMKQCLVYDGRLTLKLSNNGSVSINVAAIIFLSFNLKADYNVKTHCVMHIDKIQSNNVLSNLKIEKISKSHSINYSKGLLHHLTKNNRKRTEDYFKLTHKVCCVCSIKKAISCFEHGRNKCLGCRYLEKKENYRKSKGIVHKTTDLADSAGVTILP